MDKKSLGEIEKIVKSFNNELIKKGIHAEQILLYGSYARGNATKYSDIDLVIISKDFEKMDPIDRLTLLSHAAWPVQACIEALGYTPQEIAERGKDSILWEEIEKSHKVVYKAA